MILHSQADIITQHLINIGQGIKPVSNMPATAWPLYIDGTPDTPDQIISVYGTGGNMDVRSFRTGRKHSHPGIQLAIRVKPGQYRAGYMKGQSLADALDTTHNAVVTIPAAGSVPARTYKVVAISRTANVLSLGEDTKNREMFSLNAICSFQET